MRTIIALAILLASSVALAHDHNRPELDGWFMGLHSKAGVSCCSGSDAWRVDDPDWESRDGHYRVRIDGDWIDVPDSAVIDGPNKAGPTLVWPYYQDGRPAVRCFLPGSMT